MPDLPPVPDCEGPQLQPYQSSGTPEITFLEELGRGAHGHVFKVQIDGKVFALKVFNHQIVNTDWLTMDPDEACKVDEKLLTAQWHPFNAECRAYARLKEAKKEHVAVRCHGYLCLTEAQKKELEQRFDITSWWADDYLTEFDGPYYPIYQQKLEQEGRRSLRAIVKEFITGDAPFGPEHAPAMVSDLNQIHRAGIMVHDLNEDAYVAGKLVDFSKAVVVPHIMFDPRLLGDPNDTARGEVIEDLALLKARFREWNEEHEEGPVILCDPFEAFHAVRKLRRGPLTRDELVARCFNPLKIKWQKFSRRPIASVATKPGIVRKSGTTGKKPIGVSKRKAAGKSRKALK